MNVVENVTRKRESGAIFYGMFSVIKLQRKIGLIGPGGCGKTTSLYGIAHEIKKDAQSCNIVPEAAREAIANGLPINSTTSIDSQLWMMGYIIENEIKAERGNPRFIITDRTIYDGIAYTSLYLGNNKAKVMWEIANAYTKVKPYDLIIMFPPLKTPPEQDGVRDASISEQQKIYLEFKKIIPKIKEPVYTLKELTKDGRRTEAITIIRERFY